MCIFWLTGLTSGISGLSDLKARRASTASERSSDFVAGWFWSDCGDWICSSSSDPSSDSLSDSVKTSVGSKGSVFGLFSEYESVRNWHIWENDSPWGSSIVGWSFSPGLFFLMRGRDAWRPPKPPRPDKLLPVVLLLNSNGLKAFVFWKYYFELIFFYYLYQHYLLVGHYRLGSTVAAPPNRIPISYLATNCHIFEAFVEVPPIKSNLYGHFKLKTVQTNLLDIFFNSFD